MRPLIVGQITGVSQFAAVIAPAVLCRPHRWPSSNQATTLESQPIQGIQYVSGQTLRGFKTEGEANEWLGSTRRMTWVRDNGYPDEEPSQAPPRPERMGEAHGRYSGSNMIGKSR